jgi:hypothetical protein
LHSITEKYLSGYLFSASSARGLLIGVGNIGDQLKPFSYGDTFLSRDAGLTWTQIAQGPYLYEFGDYGTIMILVAQNRKVATLLYSINNGLNWCNLPITDTDMETVIIRDIITEPNSTKRSFLLIGSRLKSFTLIDESIVIQLDFSSMFPRMCNKSSDLEPWHINAVTGVACHMGHNVKKSLAFTERL